MAEPIDFYFDFSSPYGYLAGARIDDLAARHGRETRWRPYLMGAAMKITGSVPLVTQPMVAEYARHDLLRCARLQGTPMVIPDPFPVATVAACRAYYWLEGSDAAAAHDLAAALYAAYFAEGRNIGDAGVVLDVAAEQGHDRETVEEALQNPAVKDRLKSATQAAIDAGVFGSPYVVVDGEPFWGNDRMDQVERWLETGGW